ncbi:hypothetical protein K438DRAFT_1993396 [Mycena galopus ATCC 62051]|nr:hypothetical protein K438DRAFT_1993396 [Mycena galopus ATCC 62051]
MCLFPDNQRGGIPITSLPPSFLSTGRFALCSLALALAFLVYPRAAPRPSFMVVVIRQARAVDYLIFRALAFPTTETETSGGGPNWSTSPLLPPRILPLASAPAQPLPPLLVRAVYPQINSLNGVLGYAAGACSTTSTAYRCLACLPHRASEATCSLPHTSPSTFLLPSAAALARRHRLQARNMICGITGNGPFINVHDGFQGTTGFPLPARIA